MDPSSPSFTNLFFPSTTDCPLPGDGEVTPSSSPHYLILIAVCCSTLAAVVVGVVAYLVFKRSVGRMGGGLFCGEKHKAQLGFALQQQHNPGQSGNRDVLPQAELRKPFFFFLFSFPNTVFPGIILITPSGFFIWKSHKEQEPKWQLHTAMAAWVRTHLKGVNRMISAWFNSRHTHLLLASRDSNHKQAANYTKSFISYLFCCLCSRFCANRATRLVNAYLYPSNRQNRLEAKVFSIKVGVAPPVVCHQ